MSIHLVRSLGIVERGSTDPILVVDDHGVAWLCKVQPPPMSDHAVELIVAHLALAMVVPVAPFAVATVDDALVSALAAGTAKEREYARRLRELGPSVFASHWLPAARDVDRFGGEDLPVLARVRALDRLALNPDRRADHPNLLRVGGALVAIDHAQALPECHGGAPGAFDTAVHAASAAGVSADAATVDDVDIHAAVASVPAGWISEERREAVRVGLLERASAMREVYSPAEQSP